MFTDLKDCFTAADGSLIATQLAKMDQPKPGSDMAHQLVRILRHASTDPFENAHQRRSFVSGFNGLMDHFQLSIDLGFSKKGFTLHDDTVYDADQRPIDVKIVFADEEGPLVGSLLNRRSLGLFDASSGSLIPLTNDSPSARTQAPAIQPGI